MPHSFWPGQAAPDFLVTGSGQTPATFYERYCGQKTVLIFLPASEPVPHLGELTHQFQVLLVLPAAHPRAQDTGETQVVDDGCIADALLGRGLVDAPVAVVLRDTLTVETVLQGLYIPTIIHSLERLPKVEPQQVSTGFAPVLMVADVLPRAICQRLIAAHDTDNHESGMLREVDGKVALVHDPRTKQRRDHHLDDEKLVRIVTDALVERLLPAIHKAFHAGKRYVLLTFLW